MEPTLPDPMTSEREIHHAARPMKVVADEDGTRWLCDEEVDERMDLRKQGCWQCGELAFTRDD
jgi:streptogramin lyase